MLTLFYSVSTLTLNERENKMMLMTTYLNCNCASLEALTEEKYLLLKERLFFETEAFVSVYFAHACYMCKDDNNKNDYFDILNLHYNIIELSYQIRNNKYN